MMKATPTEYAKGGDTNNAAAAKGSGGAFAIPNTSKDYPNGRGSKTNYKK